MLSPAPQTLSGYSAAKRVENPKAVGANVGSIDCVRFH
ncbi:hypothetical protein MRBBS_1180 [Marinobacter sp. BSs20148]|nr:hypothetical protein MRBBS_1180 [Marinobacter sp. BSs20148]